MSLSAPPDPTAAIWRPTSEGRGGLRLREGEGKGGGREGSGKGGKEMGKEERKRMGVGGKGTPTPLTHVWAMGLY